MSVQVSGLCEPGFEKLYEAFMLTFEKHKDNGAACALYVDGRKVVDLWGGLRNTKEGLKWDQETIVSSFSVTKVMANMTVAVLVERGLVKYSDRVSKYWPEFAQNGKESITISELISHRAGLCFFDDGPIQLDVIPESNSPANSEKRAAFSAFLARQTPKWEVKPKVHGYHAHTVGFFVSELVRHADPKGRTLRTFFNEEVAYKLSLDFHIGVVEPNPSEGENSPNTKILANMSRVYPPPKSEMSGATGNFTPEQLQFAVEVRNKTSRSYKNYNCIKGFSPWKARFLELPSSIGFGTANSVASVMGMIANKGSIELKKNGDGKIVRLLSSETCEALAFPLPQGRDIIHFEDCHWTQGGLKCDNIFPEEDTNVIWHRGYGGPLAFTDFKYNFGFAFLTNTQHFYATDREQELLRSVYACVKEFKTKKAKL